MWRLLGSLLLLVLVAPAAGQGGRLQSLRETVDRKDDDKPEKQDEDRDDDTGSPDDDDDSDLGGLYFQLFLAPFAMPHALMKDDLSHPGYFPRHPYAHGRPGYMNLELLKENEPGQLRSWAGRVAVDTGSDFDDISRTGGQIFLESTSRFGVQGRYDFLLEHLPCGCHDYSYLGSTELTYRFAQCQHMQMHTGVGLRVLDDRWKTHYGFNFTYGADLFPAKPLVLSFVTDLGTVDDAGLFRVRGTAGVLYRGVELFSGYDYLNIGGVEFQGLLAGLRLWF